MGDRHYNYKGRTATLSKSQRKREAFNYRAAYFKKNPGLFGFIWFCSQCAIPMFGQHNVQVDHIIPLAGMGINRTINTVAICPKCNRKKSDNGGKYIAKGLFAKVIEVILFTIQKVCLLTFVYILRILHWILRSLISLGKLIISLLGFGYTIALAVIIILIVAS